jgi:hypothetical protein
LTGGARLLGVGQDVGAAAVGDLDEALFDVDVGRAVLAHGPELDQMDRRVDLGDRVEQVEGADHVVDLRVDGVLLVDHRVGSRPLLGEVDDRLGAEVRDGLGHERGVGEVAHEGVDLEAGHLFPDLEAAIQRRDRDQTLDTHFDVVVTTGEIVDDTYGMAAPRKVQCGGPPEIAVSPKDEDPHAFVSLWFLVNGCVAPWWRPRWGLPASLAQHASGANATIS